MAKTVPDISSDYDYYSDSSAPVQAPTQEVNFDYYNADVSQPAGQQVRFCLILLYDWMKYLLHPFFMNLKLFIFYTYVSFPILPMVLGSAATL